MPSETTINRSFFGLLLLSSVISISIVVLTVINIAWLYDGLRLGHRDRNTGIPVGRVSITSPRWEINPGGRYLFWRNIVAIPQSFNAGSLWAFFATGVGGLFDSLGAWYLFDAWRDERRVFCGCSALPLLLTLTTASVFRGWVVVVYGWVVERVVSPGFARYMVPPGSPGYVGRDWGTFYFNRWVCAVANQGTPVTQRAWAPHCRQSWAYMVLGTVLLVLSILNVILVLFAWFSKRDHGQSIEEGKNSESSVAD